MTRRPTGTGWPADRPSTVDDVEPDASTVEQPATRPPSSSARVVIALLLVLLGFALVVQLNNRNTDAELAAARPEDLVRILADLDEQQDRLQTEISELEQTRQRLTSGALGRQEALDEARRRADQLGILAGTLPADGPGLRIDIRDGADERTKAVVILDAVQELRGAGAEAMQISGSGGDPVRIVASTYFVDDGDALLVDGVRLAAPYTVMVIGDPPTMQTALNIPGGVVDTVRQRGGTVSVRQVDQVRITALHPAEPPRYARPTQ